jgi:hypothetical protein
MMVGIRKPKNTQPVQAAASPKFHEATSASPTKGTPKKEQKTTSSEKAIAERDHS